MVFKWRGPQNQVKYRLTQHFKTEVQGCRECIFSWFRALHCPEHTTSNTKPLVFALIFASVKICSCSCSLSVAFLSKNNTTLRAKREDKKAHYSVSLYSYAAGKTFPKNLRQLCKRFYLIWTSTVPTQSSVNTPFYYQAEICTVTVYYQRNLLSHKEACMTHKLALHHLRICLRSAHPPEFMFEQDFLFVLCSITLITLSCSE